MIGLACGTRGFTLSGRDARAEAKQRTAGSSMCSWFYLLHVLLVLAGPVLCLFLPGERVGGHAWQEGRTELS
jgi:hypothetical protein